MAGRSASVPCLHALRPRVRGTPQDVWSLGATEHTGPGRTTALYPRDIFFKRQRAYLYRFDLQGKSFDFVGLKMRVPRVEGNGEHSRQAVEIAAIGKMSPPIERQRMRGVLVVSPVIPFGGEDSARHSFFRERCPVERRSGWRGKCG
jgi:hypothetical protein